MPALAQDFAGGWPAGVTWFLSSPRPRLASWALARNGPPIRTAIAAGFWRCERGGHGIELAVSVPRDRPGKVRSRFGRSRLWMSLPRSRQDLSASLSAQNASGSPVPGPLVGGLAGRLGGQTTEPGGARRFQYAPAGGSLADGVGPGHRGPRRHQQTRHLDDARSEAGHRADLRHVGGRRRVGWG
jgi:hypothetical protein